jgi:hypothetical protein
LFCGFGSWQLLNGRKVSCPKDREAMRDFVERAIESNSMVQYLGMDGYGNMEGRLPGYVTCKALRGSFQSADAGINGGNNNMGGGYGRNGNGGGNAGPGSTGNQSMHGVPMEPINILVKQLYNRNRKVLDSCGFLRDLLGFQRCITALVKDYDLRGFFGGMSAYHDSERMARVLGVRTDFKFANNFASDNDSKVMRLAQMM